MPAGRQWYRLGARVRPGFAHLMSWRANNKPRPAADPETAAYYAGIDAHRAGKPAAACPYPIPRTRNGEGADGTLCGAYWLDGWEEGKREHLENCSLHGRSG